MMKIKLFNTLGREKMELNPIKEGEVGFYSCGPTVYDYAHLGHFRAYIFVDTLVRMLRFNGLKVNHVMNITDVGHLTSDADTGEDKLEKGAKREGKTVWEVAKFYENDFFKDMKSLNVKDPDIICRATEHIKEMIIMNKKIQENGFAYETSDGLYFDTSKFPNYHELAKLDIENLKEGARVDPNPEKRNPTDFAIWKKCVGKHENHAMKWESHWGVGFPGWHIECSAMSMKYLGETFDIHTGGVDHIPVHHTNEIAQAEGATGKKFVNYWLHNDFVMVEGSKMSKSKGNFVTMKEIKDHDIEPLAIRYLMLTTHYRSKMNFTWESIKGAEKTLNTLRENILRLREKDGVETKVEKMGYYKKKFLELINDDLDTPKTVSLLWELIRDEKEINSRDKYKLILEFDKVLGLKLGKVRKRKVKIPEEVEKMIRKRERARKKKDWKKADEIREIISEMGYIIEDGEEGIRVKPK